MWLDSEDEIVDIFRVVVVARTGIAVVVIDSATTKFDQATSHLFTTEYTVVYRHRHSAAKQ